MRRVFVERIGIHVYFTFDDEAVTVRAAWGARRRRGPRSAKRSALTSRLLAT